MRPELCDAIRSQRLVHFFYRGGFRTVEPHCYGISTAGNEVLRAYQVEGHSESGKPIGWKLFRVSEMSSLTIMSEQFAGPRPGYNPEDSAMQTIFCRL
ncbi:MAG: hypothetical protein DRG83_13180 [Deltaproteobacteria bacterium]|nr:MAG: hypothetical protein DRG83_13180 [Deltaproteobacteria bacterium]